MKYSEQTMKKMLNFIKKFGDKNHPKFELQYGYYKAPTETDKGMICVTNTQDMIVVKDIDLGKEDLMIDIYKHQTTDKAEFEVNGVGFFNLTLFDKFIYPDFKRIINWKGEVRKSGIENEMLVNNIIYGTETSEYVLTKSQLKLTEDIIDVRFIYTGIDHLLEMTFKYSDFNYINKTMLKMI